MKIEEILSQHKPALLKKWFHLVMQTYPEETARFLKNENDPFANPVGSSRFLDVTLHFLNSADDMKTVYEDSLGQYRDMAKAADAPFKNALITPLTAAVAITQASHAAAMGSCWRRWRGRIRSRCEMEPRTPGRL